MERMTMTVQEKASHLGISKPKAYELAHSANFPAVHVGKRILIPTEAFKEWLNRQASGAAQEG